MKKLTIVTICLCVMSCAPATAWDNFGHMQVAAVAWKRLDSLARERAGALLKLNPIYDRLIAGAAPEKRDQIAFIRAAIWADLIKLSSSGYISDGTEGGNRPPPTPEASQNIGYADHFMHKYWHFVDKPFSPDGTPLEQPSTPNALTRIAVFRSTLSDAKASDDVKSYDLVWLLHLVGDVHQPLHTTSRFTSGQTKGDAGGNFVKTRCAFPCAETNLHWFWDDAPGVDDDPEHAIAAAELLEAPDDQRASIADENIWINESFELSKSVVYQAPVGVGVGPFTLTSNYKDSAASTAKQQIALAGTRLGNLLQSALK